MTSGADSSKQPCFPGGSLDGDTAGSGWVAMIFFPCWSIAFSGGLY